MDFFVKDPKMEGITLVVVKKSKNEGDHSWFLLYELEKKGFEVFCWINFGLDILLLFCLFILFLETFN